ncbi:MAG: lytic transglycosylase domain-containing protein [Betaproteobacteria bacterium]|nr:lytic transglycosylase domain-containing protein [Betaproteobacteria bacterium]
MNPWLWPRHAVAIVLLWAATALAADGDDAVRAAAEAFRHRDVPRLARLVPQAQGHELAGYVDYWFLRLRIEELRGAEARKFLADQASSLLASRFRSEWLRELGRRGAWDAFDREYPLVAAPDVELRCYALHDRIEAGQPGALDTAEILWREESDLPPGCNAALDALLAHGRVTTEEIWQRLRRAHAARRVARAHQLTAWLPADQAPDAKAMEAAADHPQRYIDRLKPNFAAHRSGRELAILALQRLARSDVERAAAEWESLRARFTPEERAWVYAVLGWQAAIGHLPQALSWYRAGADAPLSDEQHEWKARACLRAQDWTALRQAIADMPLRLAQRPAWMYWLGRALQVRGREEEARAQFGKLAGQPHYYANLADEELGRPVTVPPRASPPTAEEVEAVAGDPAIRRALALLRVELRPEAVREWNWAMRERDDRGLLAAAALAQRHQIFDRAIHAAERTRAEHDFNLRYLAPFRDHVEPAAREQQLDAAWVYGLMRQESRFILDARSSAGASGLMQLMPATARWVARKLGLRDFQPARTHEIGTNVLLGTSYLRMVLESLDHHPVLASAAYNAGPGRARRWRDGKPLEAAIYIETIPFAETRDYVMKVMSNATYYAALFEGRPQSLKARLGTIGPAEATAASAELP